MEESIIPYQCGSPVVIIIFNRPKLTSTLLNVLKKVTPKKVYVIADGPKKIILMISKK